MTRNGYKPRTGRKKRPWLPEPRSHFETLNNGEDLVPDGAGLRQSGGDKDSAPHGAERRAVAGDYILSTQLLLDEGVGKRLFRFLVGDTFAVNVMGHLVNQNVIQVKPA